MVGGCPGTLASSTTKTGRHDIAEIYWICCNPRHGALLQVPLETFYQPPTLPHQGQSDQSPVIKTRDLIKTE
jgi:hypothetical protein